MTAGHDSARNVPKRVLYVQRRSGGGSVINLLLLIRHLDRDRFRPLVLFYDSTPYASDFTSAGADVRILESQVRVRSPRRFISAGTRQERLKGRAYSLARDFNRLVQRDWPLSRRIAKVIEETGADLVQGSVSPSADRASIIAAGLRKVPHLCYVQYLGGHTRLIDSPLSRVVQQYLCISGWVQTRLKCELGIRDGQTRLVYAPFEFPEVPGPEDRRRAKVSVGVADGHVLITNVGRLVRWKGQDVFLRAFAGIAKAHPHALAFVVGGPGRSQGSHRYLSELEALVRDLGLAERVRFTGHRDDVAEIMAASDIVVHSSSEPEPLGRVVMEAVALNVPVIATAAGGVPEMIRDGETGTLVRLGDVGAMQDALRRLLDDRPRALDMAVRARAEATNRFGAASFARAVEDAYDVIADL